MSDKLNGRELDMIVYDESAHVTQKMMDHLTKLIKSNLLYNGGFEVWGTTTGRIPERYCIYCKAAQTGHMAYSDDYSDGHPFFNNNLEYLEYESIRRGIK